MAAGIHSINIPRRIHPEGESFYHSAKSHLAVPSRLALAQDWVELVGNLQAQGG